MDVPLILIGVMFILVAALGFFIVTIKDDMDEFRRRITDLEVEDRNWRSWFKITRGRGSDPGAWK